MSRQSTSPPTVVVGLIAKIALWCVGEYFTKTTVISPSTSKVFRRAMRRWIGLSLWAPKRTSTDGAIGDALAVDVEREVDVPSSPLVEAWVPEVVEPSAFWTTTATGLSDVPLV